MKKHISFAIPLLLSYLVLGTNVQADVINDSGSFQISLDKESKKLIRDPSEGKFFDEQNLTIGDKITKELLINNEGKKPMKLFFHIEDLAINDDNRELSDEILTSMKMKMTFNNTKTNESEVIYEGNLIDIKDDKLLGVFNVEEEGSLVTEVSVPNEINETWLNHGVSTLWVFKAEVADDMKDDSINNSKDNSSDSKDASTGIDKIVDKVHSILNGKYSKTYDKSIAGILVIFITLSGAYIVYYIMHSKK